MNKIFFLGALVLFGLTACHKAVENGGSSGNITFDSLETTVISDFTNDLVFFRYSSLLNSSLTLQTSVTALVNTTNDANQAQAKSDWKNIRVQWEQSEGFLIGPVESNDYDPNTDTWPTDYVQMDSLLSSNNPLTTDGVKNLPQSLRGYHPLEYMLWGVGGSKTPADFTPREKLYMNSLISDIAVNNVQPLFNDWFVGSDDYQQQVLTAGKGSTQFSSRQALFLNILSVMSDICNEVGTSKMYEPFAARDSTITESPYSGNTLIDFENNIFGMQQVYLGINGGTGISNLIAAKNLQLDQQVKTAINTANVSFGQITERYEQAIFDQRVQVQNTMNALAALDLLLENDLPNYIKQNVKD
jgi:putative iron-regulated protein